MSHTFDTTTGGASANSFATVANFTAYVAKQPFAEDMPAAETTLIEKLLMAATEVINALPFEGQVTTAATQALEWPRKDIYDRRGYLITTTTVPQGIIDATCEMALFLFENEMNNAQNDSWEDTVTSSSINGDIVLTYSAKIKPSLILTERARFLINQVGLIFKSTQQTLTRG